MEILVGNDHINCTPYVPYDDRVCDLLDAWATQIRGDSEAKSYPDVLTFGFFIRRGSISKKKEAFFGGIGKATGSSNGGSAKTNGDADQGAPTGEGKYRKRIGRGLAFHVAPSNVPVNCMYTLAFGLLSGCSNIVRVPSKEFPQVEILCRTLSEVLKKHKFDEFRDRIQVLRYDRDECFPDGSLVTEYLSAACDVRVIWGGDETIEAIRRYPIGSRAKEITFADRYSMGMIDVQAIVDASDDEIAKLAKDFYNDTYLMDQNACSTPHLIAWSVKKYVDACMQKKIKSGATKAVPQTPEAAREMMKGGLKAAQDRFWQAVAVEASGRYDLADIKVSEKFADLCEAVSFTDGIGENSGSGLVDKSYEKTVINSVKKYEDNVLFVCDVNKLTQRTIEDCRGKYGLFFQYSFIDIESLKPVMDDSKVQTVAVYGIDPADVVDLVLSDGLFGVDRVVPFGKTLDIDVVWDGYDLVSEMSRIVAG